MQKILANSSAIHEIGIICEDLNIVDSKVDALNKSFPNNKIESWGQIAPELGYAQEIMGSVIYIFILVGGDDRDQEVPWPHLHQEGATGIKTKHRKRLIQIAIYK